MEFLHVSRFVTLLAGFALVILSFNVYKRKRRAFVAASFLAALSILFHLTKGLDYSEAAFSCVLFVALLLGRKRFTVKSGVPNLREALARLSLGAGLTFAYGIAGFWLLDSREFGINFTPSHAVRSTAALLMISTQPSLVPHTGYARWFLESFYLITAAATAYGLTMVFRPVVYRYHTQPHEQALAQQLIDKYGRTSLDFFKHWPDKSYFFSKTGRSFVAYRVSAGVAVSLGDPVGPPEEIHEVIEDFIDFCRDNDWLATFYQTTPEYLGTYRGFGLRRLNIGDDAVVDLQRFSLEGRAMQKIRSKIRSFENCGIHTFLYGAPVSDAAISQAKAVSDDWLGIPGRRERSFSLGKFEWEYLRRTPLFTVIDAKGQMLAFANIIPSYSPAEATVDLIRHRRSAPNGTMDYLLVKLFLLSREQGFRKFNLGMTPMAGFAEKETALPEERAVHYFFQKMNFLFSYRGLMQFKAKFANVWEPRYIVYRHVLDLPRVAVAMAKLMERRQEAV